MISLIDSMFPMLRVLMASGTVVRQRVTGLLTAERTALVLVVGIGLLAHPVAAQTGIDMLREGVCGGRGGPLIVAIWAGFVLFLVAEGIFHFVMGLRKAGKVDPSKTKEGREEAKGSTLYFAGALIVFSAERVFAFLGIPFLDCIRLTFGV